jgi:hypothetical protein
MVWKRETLQNERRLRMPAFDRIDVTVYHVRCPHMSGITLEASAVCRECADWILGIEVGDVTIKLDDDGTITVSGGGYVEEPLR